MPIRTASLTNQIHKNGARLHLAMLTRIRSQGDDKPASEREQVLIDERRALKEARAQRLAQPRGPGPRPAWMLKAAAAPKAPKAPKAAKEAKEPKPAKAAKGHKPTRAEKLTKKAENLDAAKKATKKSAKT